MVATDPTLPSNVIVKPVLLFPEIAHKEIQAAHPQVGRILFQQALVLRPTQKALPYTCNGHDVTIPLQHYFTETH